MYWKIFVKWFEIWNTVLGLIMYYSIEKRCLNNREREQKYIEEFRKRVLTNVIKKRNNLRESNRINFFFHGRGGIVYPPFILTFFFCQAQRKRRTKKEQESRQWSISKKRERERERRKMARNQRAIIPFVLSHLRAGPPLLLSHRALPPPLIGRRFILPLYRGSRRIATL